MKPRGLSILQIAAIRRCIVGGTSTGHIIDEINNIATDTFNKERNLDFCKELIKGGLSAVADFLKQLVTTGGVSVPESTSLSQEIKMMPRKKVVLQN